MSKTQPLVKVSRQQWQRWRELDKKRERGRLWNNPHEGREFEDLLAKIKAVSGFWRAVR